MVRAFPNEEIIHEEGDIDPIRDMEIITHELAAKDLQALEKIKPPIKLAIDRKNDKTAKEEMAIIEKVEELLNKNLPVREGNWNPKEIDFLNTLHLITAKPVVYLINIGENEYITKKNKYLPKIAAWIKENGGGPMLPFSADFEKNINAVAGTDKAAREKAALEAGAPTMVPKICQAGYNHLRLIHYFTAGEDEVKCWTIREGTKAPGAAGVIHTDFERGFICAEVMAFEDWSRLGSTVAVKDEGLYHQKGKDYEVADGDIIFFRFNVTS
jgi:obg-like ATPase 1